LTPITKKPTDAAAEWVSVDTLVKWIENPRKYTEKDISAVAKSIEAFGFGRSMVARRENLELIAGHRTVLAAKKLGHKFVPVRLVDLTQTKAHALALADNKLAEGKLWDDEKLETVRAELDAEDEELNKIAGFDEEDETDRDELDVEDVDVSEALEARFWITIHGPLPKQPDAIAKMREALEAIPGAVVELGLVE
jgi:ParB-like chromosome segregation protein Spo0J